MVQKIEVEGYAGLQEAVKPLEGKKVFVQFSGSVDPSTGVSGRGTIDACKILTDNILLFQGRAGALTV